LQSADDLYRAGFDAFSRGDFAAAIAEATRALDVDPAHPDALRVLGMAHYRREEYEEALVVGRRLFEAAPKDILSYTTLSLFLQKNGFIEEAEDASAKAKVLTWKKQLREGVQETPGLNIKDAPAADVSEPMMPGMPMGLPPVSEPMMPGLPTALPAVSEPMMPSLPGKPPATSDEPPASTTERDKADAEQDKADADRDEESTSNGSDSPAEPDSKEDL